MRPGVQLRFLAMQRKIRNLNHKLKRARSTYKRIAHTAAVEPEFLFDSDTGYLSEDELLNGIVAKLKRPKIGNN